MWVAFALQKLLTFFQQKFQHICVSLDVNFNESLTNDVVSFEQLGPDICLRWIYCFLILLMFVWVEILQLCQQYFVQSGLSPERERKIMCDSSDFIAPDNSNIQGQVVQN